MKLEYRLFEEDFLAFQLFTVSKSERVMKKKRNAWILLTAGSFLVALLCYWSDNLVMTIYFGLVGAACGLFYPKYFKWRLQKHYKEYIRENYSKRFDEPTKMEITQDYILSESKTGEGKIKTSEIEGVNETQEHFFIQLSKGISLIVPKKEVESTTSLRDQFKSVGLPIRDEKDWGWK
jgi:hypothetical protein